MLTWVLLSQWNSNQVDNLSQNVWLLPCFTASGTRDAAQQWVSGSPTCNQQEVNCQIMDSIWTYLICIWESVKCGIKQYICIVTEVHLLWISYFFHFWCTEERSMACFDYIFYTYSIFEFINSRSGFVKNCMHKNTWFNHYWKPSL